MFNIFEGQGEPGANCPSQDGARQEADGTDTHRHHGPFPGISRGIAVRRYFVWTAPLASSVLTAPATIVRPPSSPSQSVSLQTWEFHELSGVTREHNT